MPEYIANRYQVLNQVGEGGMGAVYSVHDRLTGQNLALKRVLVKSSALQFASRPQDDAQDTLRLALTEEFRVLASLRHPHIISVIDYGFDAEGCPFYTMPLLAGAVPLTQAASAESLDVKVSWLIDLLQALAYLHRRGIIHRDLKPDNVLITNEQVKVMDFGLAQQVDADSLHPVIAGTLAYLAPETLLGHATSVQTDLFAVGVIAYELFTAHHPFFHTDTTRLIYNIIHNPVDMTQVDERLVPVVMRLLSKDPADRHSDALSVIDNLCAALNRPIPEENAALRDSYLQASHFAGRTAELAQLTGALEEARAGRGSAWLIGGESGVGKSRLMDELRIRSLVHGATALVGQAVEGGGVPYAVWRSILPHLVLSATVSDLEASILKPLIPNIDLLLQRPVSDAPPMQGAIAKSRLSATIIELLRRQAHPIVILIEDLQWATESVELLIDIAPIANELPLLIVGNYRNDEAPSLPEQLPTMQHLTLARLDELEIAQFSHAMLGAAGTSPDVLSLLQQETEGNAFFMVEVVRALAEEAGRLVDIGRATLPQTVFAGGMRRVIARRLARVPEWGQSALTWAAINGRQIDLPLVAALSQDLDLDAWLVTCTQAAVLTVRDDIWLFSHDKLREALLERIPDGERLLMHRQVAEAIEQTRADDIETHAEKLARLWQTAQDPAKEWHYRLIAARGAKERASYQAAIDHALRAIAIAPLDAADRQQKIGAMQLIIADMQEALGLYDAAIATFASALEASRAAHLHEQTAYALAGMGNVLRLRGDLERSEQLNLEALAIRRTLADPRGVIDSLHNLTALAASKDDLQRGLAYAEEALTQATALKEKLNMAKALNNSAIMYDMLGQHDMALERYQRSWNTREAIGDQAGVARVAGNMARLLTDSGRFEEALDKAEYSLHLATQLNNRQIMSAMSGYVGELYIRLGKYDKALAVLQEGLALNRAMADYPSMIVTLVWLAHHAVIQQAYAQAASYLLEALKLREAHQIKMKLWHILHLSGIILIERGQPMDGMTVLYTLLRHPLNQTAYDTSLQRDVARYEAILSAQTLTTARAKADGQAEEDLVPPVLRGLEAMTAVHHARSSGSSSGG